MSVAYRHIDIPALRKRPYTLLKFKIQNGFDQDDFNKIVQTINFSHNNDWNIYMEVVFGVQLCYTTKIG